MTRVGISELRAQFSDYLRRVQGGETLLVCRRGTPIAELRPVSARRTKERPIGLAKGQFFIPEAFYEPLSEDILGAFEPD